MIRVLLLVLFVFGLSACGSNPPAPVDRFYRLHPVAVSGQLPAGGVYVAPFRADSLYAERPLVYSDAANPRQLRQYHYHLWLYAPAQTVHDHLTASFGKMLSQSEADAGMRLEGRVLRLDRVRAGKVGTAAVALELRLMKGERVVHAGVYTAEQAAADDSVSAHVVAVEQALASIYADFLREAGR